MAYRNKTVRSSWRFLGSRPRSHRVAATRAHLVAPAILLMAGVFISTSPASPAAARGETGSILSPATTPASWSAVTAPFPDNSTTTSPGDFLSESCPSAAFCAAISSYVAEGTPNQSRAFIDVLSGGTWTAIEAPVPADADTTSLGSGTFLQTVSCPSVGFCVAVGDYQVWVGGYAGYDVPAGLIETLSDGVWTATQAPTQDGSGLFAMLGAVSCATTTSCVAVDTAYGRIETMSDGVWSATTQPLPVGADPTEARALNAVTCSSPDSCVAVGNYDETLGSIDTLSDGSWTAVQAPLPSNAASNPSVAFSGISCNSDTSCTAIGSYSDTKGDSDPSPSFIETLKAGTWSVKEAPVPSRAKSVYPALQSVSCVSGGTTCYAVGSYVDGSTRLGAGLIDRFSAGKWTSSVAPVPAGALSTDDILLSVTCVAANSCTAVGQYIDTNGNEPGLIDTLAGKSWAALASPLPANASSEDASLEAVLCPGAGACIAFGNYQNGNFILGESDPSLPAYYVALGDSFSSGEGLAKQAPDYVPPTNTDGCHRSSEAYPVLVARSLGSKISTFEAYPGPFVACSGATSGSELDPSSFGDGKGSLIGGRDHEEPQLDALSKTTTKYVTLTIGGNDIGLVSILQDCLDLTATLGSLTYTKSSVFTLSGPSACASDITTAAQLLAPSSKIQAALTSVYQQILAASPDATLYVLNYPQLFTTTTVSGYCPVTGGVGFDKAKVFASFSPAHVTTFDTLESELNSQIASSVASLQAMGSKIQLVDINSGTRSQALPCAAATLHSADINGLAFAGGATLARILRECGFSIISTFTCPAGVYDAITQDVAATESFHPKASLHAYMASQVEAAMKGSTRPTTQAPRAGSNYPSGTK